jgi:hypothetical protein
MSLYSHIGNYPSSLPDRIRLSNGLTRTGKDTFTEEEISDAGYVLVEDPPVHNQRQRLLWTGTTWQIVDFSEEEIAEIVEKEWQTIRFKRDEKIKEVEWRIFRYQSQTRLGVPTADSEEKIHIIDEYIEDLRNITQQTDPTNIIWPTLEI